MSVAQNFAQILVFSLVFFPTIRAVGIFGTLGGILSDVSGRVGELTCSHFSCCESHLKTIEWSSLYKGNPLYELLQLKLFGQHLVQDAILRGIPLHKTTKPGNNVVLYWLISELEGHLYEEVPYTRGILDDPNKNWDNLYEIWDDPDAKYELIHEEYEKIKKRFEGALVIWMYGPTGTGKSYTTEIIAESLYKNGLNSPLVHHFAENAFVSLEQDQFEYGLKLLHWIDGNITSCPYSMFIFDNFHELPIHLIRIILKSAINNRSRQAIFLFIMNTGDSDTMEKMLALYEEGKMRVDIKLEDVYKPGFGELFSYLEKKYGFEESIDEEKFINGSPKNAIFVPFLPMEKQHVRKCIIDNYINKGGVFPSDDMIRSVQSHVRYGPVGKEKFSLFGCRQIQSLVTSVLSRRHRYQNHEEL